MSSVTKDYPHWPTWRSVHVIAACMCVSAGVSAISICNVFNYCSETFTVATFSNEDAMHYIVPLYNIMHFKTTNHIAQEHKVDVH